MKKFEIVCVTMNQNDLSKYYLMNAQTNVLFANQTNECNFVEKYIEGYDVRMISTNTSGVGINRNIGLMYIDAEICLLADDDVVYYDNVQQKVLDEFNEHQDADVFIFGFNDDDPTRAQKNYSKTRRVKRFEKKSWGGYRIAFKTEIIRKNNIWFSTLFGGGAKYPSGEDSMFIRDIIKHKLKVYVSNQIIGKVSFEKSTWFNGYNERFFYGRGAYYCATRNPLSVWFWSLYYSFRTRKLGDLKFSKKMMWIKNGVFGYKKFLTYEEFLKMRGTNG